MKTVLCTLLLLTMPFAVQAKTKEFTILGNQKIKAEVKRGMPLPAEKDGVRIEAAAFRTGADGLTFGFMLTTSQVLSKVVVEDVSGSSPVVLVEDLSPRLEKNLWQGMAKSLPLTADGVPWLFENGDTTKVFRFTIIIARIKDPVVLFQPAVYASETKQIIREQKR